MNRLLPSPALSVALFLLWIVLMQALDVGTLLLGVAMALFWPVATAGLSPSAGRIRRPLLLARLFGRAFVEMLRSNAEVAWAILTRRPSTLRSGFVKIPLELTSPNGLAALAMIVTFTPGTAWAELSDDRRVLLLHVLAIENEADLVALFKRRYERPLIEVFE
jgi:multicomponent K+:H+ antiporter subunit E